MGLGLSLRFDVKAGAKCGSLFKLDRVEFVCTFEPLTPLPLHCFYQTRPQPVLAHTDLNTL